MNKITAWLARLFCIVARSLVFVVVVLSDIATATISNHTLPSASSPFLIVFYQQKNLNFFQLESKWLNCASNQFAKHPNWMTSKHLHTISSLICRSQSVHNSLKYSARDQRDQADVLPFL